MTRYSDSSHKAHASFWALKSPRIVKERIKAKLTYQEFSKRFRGEYPSEYLMGFARNVFYRCLPFTTDTPGYLYVYFRKQDLNKQLDKTKIKLFKIGRTIRKPKDRIGDQMKANGEEYAIDRQIHSNYNRFFEYMVRSIIIIIM